MPKRTEILQPWMGDSEEAKTMRKGATAQLDALHGLMLMADRAAQSEGEIGSKGFRSQPLSDAAPVMWRRVRKDGEVGQGGLLRRENQTSKLS